jgi:hypothetical protein
MSENLTQNEIDQCIRTLALESVRQCEKAMNSISIKAEKLKKPIDPFDHVLIMTSPFMTTKISFTIDQGDEGVELVFDDSVASYIDGKMFTFAFEDTGYTTITINLEYIREDIIKLYKDIYGCEDDAYLKQLKHPDFKFEDDDDEGVKPKK